MPDNARKLYDALTAKGVSLGGYDTYSQKIKDPKNRKKLFDAANSAGVPVGDFDVFESKIASGGGFSIDKTRQPLTPSFAPPGTSETIASSPFGEQYSQMARDDRGDIAKNVISFGLPFLATGLTAGAGIPAAGALSATGEALGTKVKDLITGRQTPTDEVIRNSALSGAMGLGGELLGRGIAGVAKKAIAPFAGSYDNATEKLAAKYGVPTTASMVNRGRAVPLIESISGKSVFGDKLRIVVENAEKQLTQQADDLIRGIGNSDPSNAGLVVSRGIKNTEKVFYETKNKLYAAAKMAKGDVSVNTDNTIRVLDETIARLGDVKGNKPAILKELKSLRNGLGSDADNVADQMRKKGISEKLIKQYVVENGLGAAPGADGVTIKNTIQKLQKQIDFADKDPITTGYQADLRRITATLSEDFDSALGQARPELKSAIEKANSFYKENIKKLNTSYGQNIQKFSESEQWDKIAAAVLNKNTSVDDIPKIFEVVGDDGKVALKAELLERLIGSQKRNANQVFTPSMLDKTIKNFGKKRLAAIYTPEEMMKIKDLSKLATSLGYGQRVTEGSQTTFLARMMGILGSGLFLDPITSIKIFAGDAAMSSFIASRVGQRLLRQGYQLPKYLAPAVSSATRVGAQAVPKIMPQGGYLNNGTP